MSTKTQSCDLLIDNIKTLHTANLKQEVISDAAIGCTGGKITWIGPRRQLQADMRRSAKTIIDAKSAIATPGLIDAHSHFLFAGSRQHEFLMRLQGKTYQEIAAAGGGILSSFKAMQQINDDELLELGKQRLGDYLRQGVTTVEAKSGYGLVHQQELRTLRLLKQLAKEQPVSIVPTYMGAHAIPADFTGNREVFLKMVCDETMPVVVEEELATFVDVFCDVGAFTCAEGEGVLQRALELGLKIKIHSDEFENIGATEMAARLGVTSADHLCKISEAGIKALAASGSVAVLLPGTMFFLNSEHYAPARQLISAGVQVCIATDFNPGSNACQNLLLTGTIACLRMQMTPTEVLIGMTRHAAAAIDAEESLGSLEVGKQADIALFAVPDVDYLFYQYGRNHLQQVFKNGKLAHSL